MQKEVKSVFYKHVCIVRDAHFCSNTGLLVEMLLQYDDIKVDVYLFNMQRHVYFNNFIEQYSNHDRCNIVVTDKAFRNSYINYTYLIGQSYINGKFSRLKYDCVIGVEQMGLILGFLRFEKTTSMLLYYSLELMQESQTASANYFDNLLLSLERKIHNKTTGTIIQDSARWERIYQLNKLSHPQKIILIPVSVKGNSDKQKTRYYHNLLFLNERKNLVLFFANTLDAYFAQQLKEVSQVLDESDVIVLQGNQSRFPDIYENDIFEKSSKYYPNIHFLSDSELDLALKSVCIGLVLYSQSDSNHQLTLFSSGKIAHYTKVGVPFVAFYNPYYDAFKESMGCFELIRDINDLPSAIRKIKNDYERYSGNAIRAFEMYYSAERNFKQLYSLISNADVISL